MSTPTDTRDPALYEESGSLKPADPEYGELGGTALAARYHLKVAGQRPNPLEYARRLWKARHFIITWATATNQSVYAGSRLGQIWQVLTPILNVAVYYLIFGILLSTSRGVPDFICYLVVGVFIFNFMQTAVLFGSRAISDNLDLIRALYFPRASLPIAITIVQLQQLLISMIIMCAVALCTHQPPTLMWLTVVPALFLQFVFNAGLAMVVARFGAILKDSSQLLPFILRTWMYSSGVFYSIKSMISDHPNAPSPLVWILDHNPPLIFISLIRNALITPPAPVANAKQGLTAAQIHNAMYLPPHAWLWAVAWALVMGIGGYLYFWQGEETYGRG